MAIVLFLLALAAVPATPLAAGASEAALAPNPIRKVVNLLQALQAKVESEGAKEEELYEKFSCYCKSSGGKLSSSISGAETKIPSLEADITASTEQKAQFEADVKQARVDGDSAKQAIAEATALREKEAAAFAAYKADADSNIGALTKAVAALEKGAAGGFVQTGAAQVLSKLVRGKTDLLEADRQTVLSFLSSNAGYAPSGGEVTGILKQMGDEMAAGLADATATEEAAITSFQGLISAKKKEIEALQEAIETKSERIGELGVLIVQLKNDLEDTTEGLAADKDFLANLETTCATKKTEWEERQKTRSEELAALADTIKLLNDDDALDLFKATLPGSSSFLQLATNAAAMRAQALQQLRAAQSAAGENTAMLDRIVLALHGKQAGFEKVIELVDSLVATLKKEQQDDEHKKEYCAEQFDQADDKKKELERSVSDAETAMAKSEEAIARLTEEIAELQDGIKALDKSVADATEQRKTENEEYTQLIASNNAAKELLGVAKNRLNKFYNPKLYKEAPKQELSRADRISANMGAAALVQVSVHVQHKDAPEAPPETFAEYSKKSEESAGVMEMINMLVQDLDKEITEGTAQEKDSQADYEKLMKDAAEKRVVDSKSLNQKEASKADIEAQKESQTSAKASAANELSATEQYIASLHAECDWLLQYFDTRKEARTGEIESLGKAKDVLNGASFSLLETKSSRAFLVKRSA